MKIKLADFLNLLNYDQVFEVVTLSGDDTFRKLEEAEFCPSEKELSVVDLFTEVSDGVAVLKIVVE